ncbi:MAG: TetR/AcrR family transcriptional regulator [Myxococcota bacterium]
MGRPRETTDEQIVIASRRCFLERGIGVSAADIAKELGISHTTLFNRFGSKEGLMIAALGPPQKVEWIVVLDSGPDDRPIRTQLVEHARVIASFFRELHQGLGLLQAAGIDPARACGPTRDHSTPEQAFRAFVSWLQRAQEQGRLADNCDLEIVASTILGSLHGHAFTAQIHGQENAPPASDEYIERFVNVLWHGIGV